MQISEEAQYKIQRMMYIPEIIDCPSKTWSLFVSA